MHVRIGDTGVVQIHAARRKTGDTNAEATHWTVENDNYDAGIAEVHAAVPEGLLSVRLDR